MKPHKFSLADFLERRARSPVLPWFGLTLCVVITIYPLSDFDTFWHVANGRVMTEQHRIIDEEVLSYTAYGTKFDNHAWLAQLIFYWVVAAFGLMGLSLFKGLITGAIIGFSYATLRLYRIPALHAALWCLWLSYCDVYLMTLRPNLFSLLFIAVTFFILEGVRLERFTLRMLWVLPPVFLMWHFMHGAIYGLALLAAHIGARLMLEWWHAHWRLQALAQLPATRHHLGMLVVVMLAITLNPTGTMELQIFSSLFSPNYMVSVTGEFMPPPLLQAFAPFWITLCCSALTLIPAVARRDLIALAVLLPFAYLALRYSRAVAPFALLAVPIVARYVEDGLISRWCAPPRQSRLRNAALLLLLAATLFTLHYKFLAPRHVNSFGLGLNPEFHPAAALQFLDTQHVDGNMFNAGELGGYIAFAAPQRKIFLYNHAVIFNDLLASLRYPGALERWDVNYALLGYNWQRYAHLFPLTQWAPVYFEQASLLMVRRTARNQALINEYEIKIFSPLRTGDQNRELARDPRLYPRLMQEMAVYLTYREDPEIADAFAALIPQPHPGLTRQQRLTLIEQAFTANGDNANLALVRKSLP